MFLHIVVLKFSRPPPFHACTDFVLRLDAADRDEDTGSGGMSTFSGISNDSALPAHTRRIAGRAVSQFAAASQHDAEPLQIPLGMV